MKKFLLLLLCAGCGAVLAAEDDITFHGTLMSPPACSISGGQTIEVQFRDLIIDS
ncbi:fimbrial protein, partial [Escherichia coli]|nr:fimbrial protein [Escherichia coli]